MIKTLFNLKIYIYIIIKVNYNYHKKCPRILWGIFFFIAGLHTHRVWSTSFRLVVTWLTKRTYASTDCTGGVGETLKKTFTIWSIDRCQNRIATDHYHMTISRAFVSTHRGDVICFEPVRWPVNCFTSSRSMFNLILSS